MKFLHVKPNSNPDHSYTKRARAKTSEDHATHHIAQFATESGAAMIGNERDEEAPRK